MEAFKVDIPDGKYLGSISQDFVQVADTIKEASYQIRKAGFEFPIFPISKVSISIGQPLLLKEENILQWNYNASLLDEFVQCELIADGRTEDFKKIYKDPDEFCCLFVVDEEFTQFLFIPYPED